MCYILLIYILQTGMSYKNESILEMFGTLMSEVGENSSIEIQSLPILYGYYMWKNNEHKFFEPAMKPLYEAMEIFLNNPYVYYNNMKLEYKLYLCFPPLCLRGKLLYLFERKNYNPNNE